MSLFYPTRYRRRITAVTAADLESLKTAAAGSWKQCVAQGTLTWEKLEPPSREGGFYRVVVSEGGSL